MPALFFGIVFIAELIITFQIIALIKKCDRKVCEINSAVCALTPKIESSFTKIRIELNKILLSLNKIQQKIQAKKDKYKTLILKNIITGILFLVLNKNGKTVISVLDLVFSVKETVEKWAKNYNK